MRATRTVCICMALAGTGLLSQGTVTAPMTISQAVDRATRNFPSIQTSGEQVNAAIAQIRLARTNYLPSINTLGQINRATRNNIFGLLLPQAVIPNISGPVLGTNNGTTVWGSAAGVLVSWEPFDFGRRHAFVQSAEATRNRAEFAAKREQLGVAKATAAAFLTLLASELTVRAAQSAVDRAQVLMRSVGALVNAQLRPGADLSRASSELDAAETQLIQSQESVDVARAALMEYTGVNVKSAEVAPASLLQLPPDALAINIDVAANPAVQEQNAVIEESKARLRILERTYRPTFNLQLAGSARGTGALVNGGTLGGWNGLAPTFFNVAAGFTVDFSVLASPAIHAQEAQESAIERSESAKLRQTIVELQAQQNAARASWTQARRIAAETPNEVQDARVGFEQANAQYRSGLATIIAVAEAQRILAQAEIDDSLAWLAVWRVLLQLQSAERDITSFLAEASK